MRIAVEPSLHRADYPFTHRLRVRFAETDAMGIVHHSRYLPYLEEARVAYLRAIGHPYGDWRAAGLDSAVLEAHVRYRRPLRFDDEVDVHLVLAAVTRATFQMAYLLTRDDTVGTGDTVDTVGTGETVGTVGTGDTADTGRTAGAVIATAVTVHGMVTADGRPTRLPKWLAAMAGE